MRQSQIFSKTRREGPKDEVSKNAELLIRGGFINKEMAGVYSFLPLGLKVLKNIEKIIRREMDSIGGVEMLMPSFHPKENWVKTGRWDSMDDLYKVSDRSGREVALGPTHEEIITPLGSLFISSYKDLPVAPYQFQTKFRMELRSKSGILRGREFIMKDMYSFHTDQADLEKFYEKTKEAYIKIFEKAGIGDRTFVTFASGGTFSKYSHEFQMATEAGEDIIYVDNEKKLAINKEVYSDSVISDLGLKKESLREEKAIEVGNIFNLGNRFSEPFGLKYKNEKGENLPVLMGCYGIGLGRLMGAVVEAHHDKNGIMWPENLSPASVHLIPIGEKDGAAYKHAEDMYDKLESRGVSVLFDDREGRAGEKFADSDLIGIPIRAVVSEQTITEKEIEIKKRSEEKPSRMPEDKFVEKFMPTPQTHA